MINLKVTLNIFELILTKHAYITSTTIQYNWIFLPHFNSIFAFIMASALYWGLKDGNYAQSQQINNHGPQSSSSSQKLRIGALTTTQS